MYLSYVPVLILAEYGIALLVLRKALRPPSGRVFRSPIYTPAFGPQAE